MGGLADADTVALSGFGRGTIFAERYEVLGMLGEGGMGTVYRVRDLELGEVVALKVLRAEVAETEGALERFRREARHGRRDQRSHRRCALLDPRRARDRTGNRARIDAHA